MGDLSHLYFQDFNVDDTVRAYVKSLSGLHVFGDLRNLWKYVFFIAFEFYCRANPKYCAVYRRDDTGVVFLLLTRFGEVGAQSLVDDLESAETADDVTAFWTSLANSASPEAFCSAVAGEATGVTFDVTDAPCFLGMSEMSLFHDDETSVRSRPQGGPVTAFTIHYGRKVEIDGIRAFRSISLFPKPCFIKAHSFASATFFEWHLDVMGQFAVVKGTRQGFRHLNQLLTDTLPVLNNLDPRRGGKGAGSRRSHTMFWAFAPYAPLSAVTVPRSTLSHFVFHFDRRFVSVSDPGIPDHRKPSLKRTIVTHDILLLPTDFGSWPIYYEAAFLCIPYYSPYTLLQPGNHYGWPANKPLDFSQCQECSARLVDIPIAVAVYVHMCCCCPEDRMQPWWGVVLENATPVAICRDWTNFFRRGLLQHTSNILGVKCPSDLCQIFAKLTRKCAGATPKPEQRLGIMCTIATALLDVFKVPKTWCDNFDVDGRNGRVCGPRKLATIRAYLNKSGGDLRTNGIRVRDEVRLAALARELKVDAPRTEWTVDLLQPVSADQRCALACLVYGHFTWHWRWMVCMFASFLDVPSHAPLQAAPLLSSRANWEAAVCRRTMDPATRTAMRCTLQFVEAIKKIPAPPKHAPLDLALGKFVTPVPDAPVISRDMACVIGNIAAGLDLTIMSMVCHGATMDFAWVMASSFICLGLQKGWFDRPFLGCVQHLSLHGLLRMCKTDWSCTDLANFDPESVSAMILWVLMRSALRNTALFNNLLSIIKRPLSHNDPQFLDIVRGFIVFHSTTPAGRIPIPQSATFTGTHVDIVSLDSVIPYRRPEAMQEWAMYVLRDLNMVLGISAELPPPKVQPLPTPPVVFDMDDMPLPLELLKGDDHEAELGVNASQDALGFVLSSFSQ